MRNWIKSRRTRRWNETLDVIEERIIISMRHQLATVASAMQVNDAFESLRR
jgi:hypothetical protein